MVATTDLIKDRLKELDSTLDIREGTALYEFLVKPLALILSPLRSEIDEIKQFQSISTAETLPESELDLLASNFFITRNDGDRATTTVRIFITEAVDITLEVGAIFDAKNGQQFTNIESFTFSKSEINLNKEGELFYFDVQVLSLEKAAEANIKIDEITSMDVDVPGFVNLKNIVAATGGRRPETNTELVDRIKKSISLRNLITSNGISTIITENFSDIFEVKVVGFGDSEMHRDTTLGVHVGGRVDVYAVSTSGFKTIEEQFSNSDFLPADSDGRHIEVKKGSTLKVSIKNVPLIRIIKIENGTILSDGTFSVNKTLVENNDYTLNVEDISGLPPNTESRGQHFRFSDNEILDIQIDAEHLENSEDIRVTYEYADFISTIQDFVNEAINRVVASDILVKTFVPAFIDMSLTITTTIGSTPADYQTAITDFINNLRTPTIFEVSDIIDLVYDLNTTDQVDLPIKIVSRVIKPDGTTATVTSENELNFESIEDTTVPVTPNIIHTHANNIVVTTREKEGFPS